MFQQTYYMSDHNPIPFDASPRYWSSLVHFLAMESMKRSVQTNPDGSIIESTDYITSEETTRDAIEMKNEDTEEQCTSSGAENGCSRLEHWNSPRININKYFATIYCFIIMGMNDAAYGVSRLLLGS